MSRRLKDGDGPVGSFIAAEMARAESAVRKSYQQYRNPTLRSVAHVDYFPLSDAIGDVVRAEAMTAGQVIAAVHDEMVDMADDLSEQNPWHEAGPTEPPFHSAEVWHVTSESPRKGRYVFECVNPKHYLAFLEAGWSPQAPPGWILAAWTVFKMKLTRRLGDG
jgi:hypothetical protein